MRIPVSFIKEILKRIKEGETYFQIESRLGNILYVERKRFIEQNISHDVLELEYNIEDD